MLFGIVLIGAVIVGIMTYGAFFAEKMEVDMLTGCPVNGPVERHVVLVDQTDTFSAVQAADIQNQFENYKNQLPRYGEMVVYTIRSGVKGLPIPIKRVCNPGGPKDINQLVESAQRSAQKWSESFNKPMKEIFLNILKPNSSKSSPIIETIQAVTVKEFGPKLMDGRVKKLIIISDFLQYSSALSHYKKTLNLDRFFKSKTYTKLRADLRDVEIDMLYVFRNTQKANQNSSHRNFWIRLFEKQHGVVDRVYEVSG
jgi:hypothetical protein